MTLLDSLLALVIFFIIILSQMGRGGRRGVVKRFRCRFLSSRFISFLHPLVSLYYLFILVIIPHGYLVLSRDLLISFHLRSAVIFHFHHSSPFFSS